MFLFWGKRDNHKCNFERLDDNTDEHYYIRRNVNGFNMHLYKYSLELYKCNNCGKIKRKKFVWITLPNTGSKFYLN